MGDSPQVQDDCPIYLCIAAIVKNEGDYLAEWVEFHQMQGVEKFLIYDNGSTDNIDSVLQPYINEGLVELIPWINFHNQANHQHLAYAHAIAQMTGKTRWLAFLDLDEFLYSPSRENIADILKEKQHQHAIIVHLSDFGPSGHQTKPDGLVIENYTKRLEHNQFIQLKSIVQPHLIYGIRSASLFHNVLNNIPGYDENGNPVMSYEDTRYSAERLRVNHYMTRSIEEYEQKNSRRYFWREKNNAKKKLQKVDEHSIILEASIHDDDILTYAQEIKKRLKARQS